MISYFHLRLARYDQMDLSSHNVFILSIQVPFALCLLHLLLSACFLYVIPRHIVINYFIFVTLVPAGCVINVVGADAAKVHVIIDNLWVIEY